MKILELESENHKIDQGKSKEEKLAEGWEEEERTANIDGTDVKIKVLKKELAKGAYVREYQNDGKIPANLVGEQLFNWNAVVNLGLQDRLPTWKNMQAMAEEDYDEFTKNNFKKFPGRWDSTHDQFHNIGYRAGCRLAGMKEARIGMHKMSSGFSGPEFGFSLRLLKKVA